MKNETYERVNITLPSQTLARLDRTAGRGERSRFINDAVTAYFATHSRADIERMLKEGALARAERDQGLAEDLFALVDAWQEKA